jgi:hypothetical protein
MFPALGNLSHFVIFVVYSSGGSVLSTDACSPHTGSFPSICTAGRCTPRHQHATHINRPAFGPTFPTALTNSLTISSVSSVFILILSSSIQHLQN